MDDMFDDGPDVEDVVQRFLADITSSVDGVNLALPFFGKELTSLRFNSETGAIDIELEDSRVIH